MVPGASDTGPAGSGLPPAGANAGADGGLAGALALALNKRKQKVSASGTLLVQTSGARAMLMMCR